MIDFIKKLFEIEKKPVRGLLPLEWLVLGYMGFTLVVLLFAYTKVQYPDAMIWGRARIGAMTVALWAVYRLMPCRLTRGARVVAQMALLAWWYPDTYEINRMFPNLDNVFAAAEQSLFGFQPALAFSAAMPWPVMGELMSLGYASYYPMIALVVFFYFFCRYGEFERCSFVILASFFIYYAIFIFVPVAGPTFYFKAIGLDNVAHGIFPALGDYFNSHTDCLPTPGYQDGIFYQLVEDAKAAGERPTAAFPSSHVGIGTVCLLLACHSGNARLAWLILPFFVLLSLSTVYIQAHYLIDALAGLASGVVFYYALMLCTKRMKA